MKQEYSPHPFWKESRTGEVQAFFPHIEGGNSFCGIFGKLLVQKLKRQGMKILLSSLLVFLALSIQGQTFTYHTIRVEPFMEFQAYEHFDRLVLVSNDENVEFIADFTFEWGYKYELNVKVETFDTPLSDGTAYDYVFIRDISKVKVPETYEFSLYLASNPIGQGEEERSAFTKLEDGAYLYLDEVQIEVPDHLKHTFLGIVNGGRGRTARFNVVNSKRIRLVSL